MHRSPKKRSNENASRPHLHEEACLHSSERRAIDSKENLVVVSSKLEIVGKDDDVKRLVGDDD